MPNCNSKMLSTFCAGDGRNQMDNSMVVTMEINGIMYQGVLFAQAHRNRLSQERTFVSLGSSSVLVFVFDETCPLGDSLSKTGEKKATPTNQPKKRNEHVSGNGREELRSLRKKKTNLSAMAKLISKNLIDMFFFHTCTRSVSRSLSPSFLQLCQSVSGLLQAVPLFLQFFVLWL